MKKTRIALQLYSVRDLCKTDFAGTVASVAGIGYAGVELAGTGNLDAEAAAKAIKDAGLQVAGMHVGVNQLRADLTRVAVEAHMFGSRHVTCPHFHPSLFRSAAACQAIGEEMNEIGATLRAYGIQFSYHNHDFELKVVEGRRGFDWLLDACEPRNVGCEADVYWVQRGGSDPAAFIREQGRRIQLLHLKDETELGLGPVKFDEVFAAADGAGSVEWYIVEQEKCNHAPMESMRLNFEQLKKWGKA